MPCTLDAWLKSGAAHITWEWLHWLSYCPKRAFLLVFCEPRGQEIKKYFWNLNDLGVCDIKSPKTVLSDSSQDSTSAWFLFTLNLGGPSATNGVQLNLLCITSKLSHAGPHGFDFLEHSFLGSPFGIQVPFCGKSMPQQALQQWKLNSYIIWHWVNYLDLKLNWTFRWLLSS